MNMIKETYERLTMDVTKFDVEDVITTSGVGPGPGPGPGPDPGGNAPAFNPNNPWEMPAGF